MLHTQRQQVASGPSLVVVIALAVAVAVGIVLGRFVPTDIGLPQAAPAPQVQTQTSPSSPSKDAGTHHAPLSVSPVGSQPTGGSGGSGGYHQRGLIPE